MKTHNVLPSRKQKKKAVRKVLKAVQNHYTRLPIDYSIKTKANRKTGLVSK